MFHLDVTVKHFKVAYQNRCPQGYAAATLANLNLPEFPVIHP
jgi:hypothetical protein